MSGKKQFDVVMITGDPYVDHPFCGAAVISRMLDDAGFSVGIIETPDWKNPDDFAKLGEPKLFFGITSGAIDSMLENYTPMIKDRENDKHSKNVVRKPDRAVISYANMVRRNFKETPIVIGGVEAALRRFAHFDYWSNKIRRSILPESRANILVYGNPEYAIIEIAKRYSGKKSIDGIPGTCIARNTAPEKFNILPSFKEVLKDKRKFCKMQVMFNNEENLAQKIADKYILQYKSRRYTTKELDYIYELDYSRDVPATAKHLKGMQFSVVTHRGCFGNCSFCSIALMQGTRIVSRSEESILNEIKKITKHKDFKGYIDDLGGPSANMYGMDCCKCSSDCMSCDNLDRSHEKIIHLMQKAREIEGVKKVFMRSGIRHDLAVESRKYIEEISRHHVSGYLKIAPEHTSPVVLKLMNKYSPGTLEKFIEYYKLSNKENWQSLKYYLITAHPGSTKKENDYLKRFIREVGRDAILQTFTPTPMTVSTCMYYTEIDPRTGDGVYVPRGFRDKKDQKNELMNIMGENMGKSFRHDKNKSNQKNKRKSDFRDYVKRSQSKRGPPSKHRSHSKRKGGIFRKKH